MVGGQHKLGFLFLYELMTGVCDIRVHEESQQDCSFSLAKLLCQQMFLKVTKLGDEIKPAPHYLPFAVIAVLAPQFIPTPNQSASLRRPTSLPFFPPLPIFPYDKDMTKGFLLHRQGTPVNTFLMNVAQYVAGFIQICQEFQSFINKSPKLEIPFVTVTVTPTLSSTLKPSDTACHRRVLKMSSLFAFADFDSLFSSLLPPSRIGNCIRRCICAYRPLTLAVLVECVCMLAARVLF